MSAPVLIARFRDESGLSEAMRRLKEEPLGQWQIHSPHPVKEAEGPSSLVPMITLAAS